MSYEVHNSDGKPPKKIKAAKVDDKFQFELEDAVTGEHYQIILDNVGQTEAPVMLASGPDGVLYAYDYDAADGFYTLTSNTVDAAVIDNMLLAGGTLAGVAALAGIAISSHSGGKHHSSSSSAATNPDDNTGVVVDDNNSSDPAVVPATKPALSDDVGNPIADGTTTNDSTPTFGGEGMQPGSTVTITDGDTVIGEVTAGDDGEWSFTPDQPLTDGEHAIVVDGTAADGSTVSDGVNIVIDAGTAEGEPEGETGSEQGAGEAEGEAGAEEGTGESEGEAGAEEGNGEPEDESGSEEGNGESEGETGSEEGTGEPEGETGSEEGTGEPEGETGSEEGTGEPEGETGSEEDNGEPEGETGSEEGTGESEGETGSEEDTRPVITDDEGNPIADGSTTTDTTPSFGGEGMQPGSTVTITDGDTVIGEVTAGDDGEWSFTPDQPLADGEHAIVVDGTAADGSTVSDGVNIVVDAGTAEGEPEGETGSEEGTGEPEGETGSEEEITRPVITDDEGNPIADGSTTTDSTPSFGGEGMQPGSTVTITDGDTVIGEVIAGDDGEWSFTPDQPLTDGEHAIVVDGTAADGSTVSDDVTIIVDAGTAEGEPEGETGSEEGTGKSEGETGSEEDTRPVITDDEGNPIADGSTTTDTTPSFGGEGMQPGSTVTITDGDTVIGEVTAGDDGEWSFTPDQPLTDGEHAIVVDGTAADGSTVRDDITIIVDAGTAEGEPEGETGSEEGNGEPEGETGSEEGTGEPEGETGSEEGTGESEGETGSEEGITAPVITDDEGNPIADGSTTTDSTPSFGGEGMQPGSTVTITDGDTVIGEVIAGDDGEWNFTPDQPLADGEHAIVVDGTAADGSTVSDDITIIVDAGTAEGEPEGETGSEEGTGESEGETGSEESNGEPEGETGSEEGTGEPEGETGSEEATTAPVIIDDEGNAIADGSTTTDSTPSFGGEGMQPGSTVTITDGDTVIGEVIAGDDGEWSFTPDQPLTDGEHAIVVDGTAADGSTVSDGVNIVIDAGTAEGEPEGETGSEEDTRPVITDDEGNAIADGSTTTDSTPSFGGEGMQPGSTVTITDGDTVIGEVIAGDDGEWNFTPDQPLADGEHAIVVDGTAADGSTVSDGVNIVIDAGTAEGEPEGETGSEEGSTAPVITDDEGNPIADGSTTTDSTPSFGGEGMQPGSTVTITDGDTVIGEVIAGDDGEWSFTPDQPLTDGEHAIVVDGTAADGSTVSDGVNIVIDAGTAEGEPEGETGSEEGTGEPEGETGSEEGNGEPEGETGSEEGTGEPEGETGSEESITAPVITDDEGNAIADGSTTNDSTPSFGGEGMQPGSTVTITDGDTVIGEVTAGDDDEWSFTPDQPLTDGEHAIVVDGTDASGNAVSDEVSVIVETPVISVIEITDNNGNLIHSGDTVNDNDPTISGKDFVPGSTIVIADGEVVLANVEVDADGNWSFTPESPLSEGEHSINVTVTDPQGVTNEGSFNVIVDTTPPAGVDITGITLVDDNGDAVIASDVMADNTPTFSGQSLEAGATVIVRDGDTVLGETTVDEDGNWSFTPSEKLVDGDHSFTFEVIDQVGNSSGISDALDLAISVNKGINTGMVVSDDDGNIITDGDLINDSTPTFSGKDQLPGSTVTLTDGDSVLGVVDVAEDGSWSITPAAPLDDGDHALSVSIEDHQGNSGSDTINVVIDTLAPEPISLADITLTDEAGTILEAGSEITETTPTFTAEGLEAGSTVVVRDNGTVLGEAAVDENGNWSFMPDAALSEGEHDFTFEAVDAAGNSSGESAAVEYVVDSVAPEAVNLSTVVITDEAGEITNPAETQSDSKLTFSGSDLEPGATVTLYDKGEAIGETPVAEDGSWQFTAEAGLYDGSHELTFVTTDAAGNSSDPSAVLPLNVQAIELSASDNISSGAAVGFTYPVSVEQDLGTVLSDGGLIAFNNQITSDPIVVKDGTIMDLQVNATSSSFVNVASNSTLVLQKLDPSTGEWVTVSQEESGNLFGMFGMGASTSSITLSGLTAGQYQLVYTTSGINLGASFDLEASKTVYTLAEQGTPTDYTTAIGNVITDVDSAYGTDGIPHGAYTSVTSVSVTNSEGIVTSAEMNQASPKTTLVGRYGTLVINADGSYEYTPDSSMDSIGKVDSFTYTITDSATGKTASAQLHVQIGSTNDALQLSWNATDPAANAVTDIASNNEANASITVIYETSSASDTDVKLTAGGTENYSSTFSLTGTDDIVTGSLTLTTEWGLFGNNFATDLNITYAVQMQNGDGSWSTVKSQNAVVAAGQHNAEVIQDVAMADLLEGLGEGTYRVAISTTGAENVVKLDLAVETVSASDYVITTGDVATGNILTDEGTDGTADKLSSVYTRIFVKAGDSSSDRAIDDSYTHVTESGVTITGQYGTLVIYNNGAYTYTPGTTTLPAGSEDVFTYALKGANGEVVTATVTIHLGVEVDGSNGGALVFHGTEADDVFDIHDVNFTAVEGGNGNDTLAWHGNGQLVLSSIAAKVSDIEAISLTSTDGSDNLVIDAQSVADVTNDANALYIKGVAGDSVTLEGVWVNSGTVVVENVFYTHYTATAADNSSVDIYLQQGLTLSPVEYQNSEDGTAYNVAASQAATGTTSDDTFSLSDTGFASIDGGEGFDTLVWSGTGTLTLSDIASKISNIEEIDLVNDSSVNNLVITAQNVAQITDDQNTLFVKGAITDTLTLSGSWALSGHEVFNNVDYVHYVSTTAEGQVVNLYVDSDIKQSGSITLAEDNAADITGQVSLLSDSIDQTTTLNTAFGHFSSESFTVNNISDLQEISISVSGAEIDTSNLVSINWSLQVYNSQTLRWDTVTEGSQPITAGIGLNVSLEGQPAGTYRVVVDSTQSGYPGLFWTTNYDVLTVRVAANIVSTTDYKVSTSSSVTGSVFTSDSASDSALLVKSIAAGIVSGAASYTLIAAAGTTVTGTYGTLTIHNDGSYTYQLNSNSVIKLSGSEDTFTYVLADGTVKNLVMTLGVAVDGSEGGALIFAGTVGNDSFMIHDTQFTSVDGKAGQDTLIWNGEGDLQLSEIAGKVSNIEAIDLQSNAVATVLMLDADDIKNITDDSNVLYVRGGSEDSLSLQGVWQANGAETLNNITYTLYTGTALDGTPITLYVQQGLTFNEVAEGITGSLSEDASVVSVSQNGEVMTVADDAVSFKGAYGTLTIDGEGHYNYVADVTHAQSGLTDTFTYTLSDGSNAALSFNLGIDVDGSAGGEILFSGTKGGDIFEVYDTSFTSINGADGQDTLAWHGSAPLNLSDISAKVDNIETINLLNDSENDKLIISAESLLKVTDDNNTLYVRGADGDTVTLKGSWDQSSDVLVNGVSYHQYTSAAADGSVVQLYVEDDVNIG
ncbi:Ig-like domain-containing protein [Pantoea brenneri]|uniref:BapA/Bap/LapF family large adhesin n=1 Tax=Pantoea brenneri TaxID=472694 RepID=UPI00210B26D7|nr:Ig-like domain-containing protein [Pantoea brenneri]